MFFCIDPPEGSPYWILEFECDPRSTDFVNIHRGEHELAHGTQAIVAFGREPADHLATTTAILDAFSDRALRVLATHQLTGWKGIQLSLSTKPELSARQDGYSLLIITGRCQDVGRENWVATEGYVSGDAPIKTPVWKGVCVNGWDGSDIFLPEEDRRFNSPLVTKHFVEVVSAAGLTNFQFVPVKELYIDRLDGQVR